MDIRFCAVQYTPITLLKQENGTTKLWGVLEEFFQLIIYKLKINNYKIVKPSDGYEYGLEYENGSWNGLVGMLHRNECDMSITPLQITFNRTKVINFSKILINDPHTIMTNLIKESQIEVTDYISFIDPIIFLLLMVLIVILIITYISEKRMYAHFSSVRIIEEIWNLFSLMLHQQYQLDTNLDTYTSLLSYLSLCLTILYLWFCSFIGSQIVVSIDKNIINTFSQLADAQQLIPTLYSGTALETFLKNSTLDDNIKIWKRVTDNKQLSIIRDEAQYFNQQMISLLSSGKVALIEPFGDAKSLKSEYCRINSKLKLYISNDNFFQSSLALGFWKGIDSNTINKINSIIDSFIMNGLFKYWFNKMFRSTVNPLDIEVKTCIFETIDGRLDSYESISVNNVKSLLLLFIYSIVSTSLVLISEYLCSKYFLL